MLTHIDFTNYVRCYGKPIRVITSSEFGLPIYEYPTFYVHINERWLNPLKWMWNYSTGLIRSCEFFDVNDGEDNWEFVLYKLPRLEIPKAIPQDQIFRQRLFDSTHWKSNNLIETAINFGKKYLSPLYTIYMDCHAGNWGRYNGKLYLFDPFYVKY